MISNISTLKQAIINYGYKIPKHVRQCITHTYRHAPQKMRGGFTRLGYTEYRVKTESGDVLMTLGKYEFTLQYTGACGGGYEERR